MINLGDYLGQLLSELTIARAQADMEAIRIAELYANHELLKHFPVPRVRMKDVDLDIPVVVVKTEDSPSKGIPRGGLLPKALEARFLDVLQRQLERYSLKIDDETAFMASVEDVTDQIERPDFVQIDTNLAADRFTTVARKYFERQKSDIDPEKLGKFVTSLRRAVRTDFINARLRNPRVVIGATSAEIREAPAEAIVHVSLKISEEGLEWTFISSGEEDGAEENYRLVPE